MLIPVIGLPTLYLLDAIALLATLWATWRLPAVPPAGRGARHRAGLREVVAGFRYAALHKVLLVSFLVDIVAMGSACRGWCSRRWPSGRSATHAAAASRWACCSPRSRSGWSSAGLFSGWLHRVRRQGVAVTVAICVWGAGVALFGLTGSLWLAVLCLAVAGAGDLVSSVYRSSMLQSVATDEMRGRMQGVFIVVVAGGPRLADLWHGPAAAGFGPGPAATAGGVAVVVLALAVVARYPAFWRYRAPPLRPDPDSARCGHLALPATL